MKRIDDLQCGGLVLVQDDKLYSFTTDAVLLANFVRAGHKDKVVELCAGTGVISTLLAYKKSPKEIIAVEIQQDCCNLFNESINLNKQSHQIKVVNEPLQNISRNKNFVGADVVVVNPPYYEATHTSNKNEAIALSTHEIAVTLDEVLIESEKLLKFGGRFYLVHHTDRLAEIMHKLVQLNLQPKQLQFVQPKPDEPANLVLIEAVKGGKVGLKVNEVLIFRDKNGEETEAVKKIYNRLK